MKPISRHLTRCFIAGIVALLPVGGTVLAVVYAEYTIASGWLEEQEVYFPGLGLLAVTAIIYVIGLLVSTFLGRWLWRRIDRLLGNMPVLGQIYQTLKQILGYGEGREAIFHEVVLIPSRDSKGEELGLVTSTIDEGEGTEKLMVFVPGAPNPTAGRLLILDRSSVRAVDVSVSDALKSLVSVGKTSLALERGGA